MYCIDIISTNFLRFNAESCTKLKGGRILRCHFMMAGMFGKLLMKKGPSQASNFQVGGRPSHV